MTNKTEEAIQKFKGGYNCAQSVLSAFIDDYSIDKRHGMSLASGFGAGMGRLQETCGAVTGAYMVIGIHNESLFEDMIESREATCTYIQEFSKEFLLLHGSTHCRELLNCDLRTKEGQDYFEKQDLHSRICESCVKSSVEILNKIL